MTQHITRRAALGGIASLAAGSLGSLPLGAFAQAASYPERPITIISPFGGAVDILARLIVAQLNKRLNGNVIVDLKLGGSGTIGLAAVARAAPDGYTIGMGTSTALTSAPHLIKNPGYDIEKSFTYLGLIQTSRQVLVVSPALGVNTVQEFIALAKSKPGQFNFGSSGIGNSIHLAAEEFNHAVGIKAVHIPFKAGPETDAAIMAGQVQYTFASVPTSIGLIRGGKLKPLVVTGDSRDPSLPDVPSLKEVGSPAKLPDQMFGMVAPVGIPAPILAKLSKAIQDMQADPEFQAAVKRGGGIPSTVFGDDFRKQTLADSKQWGDLIKRLGIRQTDGSADGNGNRADAPLRSRGRGRAPLPRHALRVAGEHRGGRRTEALARNARDLPDRHGRLARARGATRRGPLRDRWHRDCGDHLQVVAPVAGLNPFQLQEGPLPC